MRRRIEEADGVSFLTCHTLKMSEELRCALAEKSMNISSLSMNMFLDATNIMRRGYKIEKKSTVMQNWCGCSS